VNIAVSPTVCHVAALTRPLSDSSLANQGVSQGLVLFGIPSAGILFRCRAEGTILDLEFGSILSALRFITHDLKQETIRSVRILSSQPKLVFALYGRDFKAMKAEGDGAFSLLAEYARMITISVEFVPPQRNLALLRVGEYPTMPEGKILEVNPEWTLPKMHQIKPIQTGVKL
jgi:hypothetical protein